MMTFRTLHLPKYVPSRGIKQSYSLMPRPNNKDHGSVDPCNSGYESSAVTPNGMSVDVGSSSHLDAVTNTLYEHQITTCDHGSHLAAFVFEPSLSHLHSVHELKA